VRSPEANIPIKPTPPEIFKIRLPSPRTIETIKTTTKNTTPVIKGLFIIGTPIVHFLNLRTKLWKVPLNFILPIFLSFRYNSQKREREILLFQIKEYTKETFTVSTDRSKVDVNKVCDFLARSYWANNRKRETIIKSIEHSLCFSLFDGYEQIGFARVITDGATFAYLCDVFLEENYRGKKLGTWLLQCILDHPDVTEVRRFCLVTKDAHEFYKQFGFTSLHEPERFMEKLNT
jgi:N-acetylglutamate synthase-like GNAT family acetyltransferase